MLLEGPADDRRARRATGGIIGTDTDLIGITTGKSSVTLTVKSDVKNAVVAAAEGGSLCFAHDSTSYCASTSSSTSTTATATTVTETTTTPNRNTGSDGSSANAFGAKSASTSILIACILAAVGLAVVGAVLYKVAKRNDGDENTEEVVSNRASSPEASKTTATDGDGWGESPHSGLKWDYRSTGSDANTAETPPRDGAPDSPGFEAPPVIRSLEFGQAVEYELASPDTASAPKMSEV